MTWSQIPALVAVLLVVGVVLVCWPSAVARLSARWEARQAHARRPRTLPLPVEPRALSAGRHRPEHAGPDAVSATGIMRALTAEADRLPAIPRGAVKR